jgi:endonuclease/exonuclease/phosphatase family metal-dependent hydrolase
MRVSHRAIVAAALAGVAATTGGATANPTPATPAAAVPASPLPASPLCGKAAPVHPAAPAANGSLRIAQFNVLHGLTTPGDHTLAARTQLQVRELAAANVDIVGLEEVSETGHHGRVIATIAGGMARRTHETWWWCWFRTEPHAPGAPDTRTGGGDPLSDQLAAHYNSNDTPWYEGAAILSRWPIVASAVHRLPGEDPAQRLQTDCAPPFTDPTCPVDIVLEPRAALWTRIATPYDDVSVTVAHTSGNVDQHKFLATWALAQSRKAASAFLVCDCNSVPTDPAQAALRSGGWRDTYRALHPTGGGTADQQIDASHPTVSNRIDYVFRRPGSYLDLRTSVRFMNTPERSTVEQSGWLWPSDHWGVLDTVARVLRPPHTG